MFGTVAYDIKNEQLASNSIGIAYDNSCLTFSVAYSETREDYSDIVAARQINFLLSLRTLGEAQLSDRHHRHGRRLSAGAIMVSPEFRDRMTPNRRSAC